LVLHIASIVISVIYIIITGVMSQDKYGITLVAFYAWIGLAAVSRGNTHISYLEALVSKAEILCADVTACFVPPC
jgi:hypothetical protein